ncbi:MFS transporter [Pedobacter nutrimenti]|jgi:MFS family permease|uniref:MFS transporter n=1 Tax=Pedobacter nutrimenti TaxID=1241337 RepID=A0A318UKQ6_9SPHI|nr:MFS transporter [Pedobacter nutrimenti]PYF76964.1 MFS transporter [Pedobacter nutrimenti]
MNEIKQNKNVFFLVLVAALGYFVDIYDLLLFLIIKNKSLASLGVPTDKLTQTGLSLMNWQMAGLLTGGILWGIIGDKKGRLSVLFGSILLYSLANIANGFATSIPVYAALRFIAGIGLAGELGAGITLVSESMSKEKRGYGTMLVAGIGLMGAVAAYIVGDLFEWRTAFFVGGGLGVILLLMRIGVFESGLFENMLKKDVSKGNFLMLFHKKRFFKYLNCILIAVPVWFVVGILVGIAPDFGKALDAKDLLDNGKGVMFTYIGISLGDFLTGTLSQVFKTRKKIVFIFLTLTFLCMMLFLFTKGWTAINFYILCIFFGIFTGYWVVFVTIAAEQFGTNLRATVTTSVPNMVRGSLILVTILFQWLRGNLGIINAAVAVAIITVGIAYIALYNLDETYGRDLNFVEE